MRDHAKGSSSGKAARVIGRLAWLLAASGLIVLGWCAILVADTILAQRAARRSLATRSVVAAGDAAVPSDPLDAPAPGPGDAVVHPGSAVAALWIPRVHLSAVVLHGSDAQTLRRGPGHLEASPMPGETGNVVIAGHRDSFFRPLRDIQVGDDIFIDTPRAHSHYRVTSLRVVRADDLSVIRPEAEPVLTLITCFPFWVLGSAPDRFVVRAVRVGDESVTPTAATIVNPPHPARPPSPPPVPADDAALIRRAIERFRLVYNGRLDARNDLRTGGPLRFEACDVAITDSNATATCDDTSEAPSELEPHLWTFVLRRGPGEWSVTSIVTR